MSKKRFRFNSWLVTSTEIKTHQGGKLTDVEEDLFRCMSKKQRRAVQISRRHYVQNQKMGDGLIRVTTKKPGSKAIAVSYK